jgi:RHS repeat-associated protein
VRGTTDRRAGPAGERRSYCRASTRRAVGGGRSLRRTGPNTGGQSDPFGGNPGGNAWNVPVANPWRFSGSYYDSQTSLYKLGQRYYDASLARWTQVDALSDPLDTHGWNRFVYAGDDPVNFTDTSGLGVCGPGGSLVNHILNWLIPDHFYGVNFRPACRLHDECYGHWGTVRRTCDQRFYLRLVVACWEGTLAENPYFAACSDTAHWMYRGVRRFGNYSFRPAQRRSCPSSRSSAWCERSIARREG